MSLTTSAATALWTALSDDEHDRNGERWLTDPRREQRDLYTQFVISLALGLGAFMTFCVSMSISGYQHFL